MGWPTFLFMSEENGTGNTLADVAKGDIDKVKEKLAEKPDTQSLHMSRVPTTVVQEFKDLAKVEFADDYGMALTFLLRMWQKDARFERQFESLHKQVKDLDKQVGELYETEEDQIETKVETLNE